MTIENYWQTILFGVLIGVVFSCKNDKSQGSLVNPVVDKIDKTLTIQKELAAANADEQVDHKRLTYTEMIFAARQLGVIFDDSIPLLQLPGKNFDLETFEEFGLPFFLRECGFSAYFKDLGKGFKTSTNIYSVATEDFNYDITSFLGFFEGLSEITKGKLKFDKIEVENLGEWEEVPIELAFSCNGKPYAIDLKLNNGHLDRPLLEKICEVAEVEKVNMLFWSQDGLSYTVFSGTTEFIQNISQYLKIAPCSMNGE